MCGRFVISSPLDIIKSSFAIDVTNEDVIPNYNVCPTQLIPSILNHNGKNILTKMHWGLVPSWAIDKSVAVRMINARSETISEKPSFRNAFKKRRCLIPAEGYYEWKGEKGNKQPYYITSTTGVLVAFAGLWERWTDKESPDSSPLVSCTIVTTAAIPLIEHIHTRMPVILAPQYYEAWLNPKLEDVGEIHRILQYGAVQEMGYYPVSKAVNSIRNNGSDLIQKITI
jgi:putative SOS response-associated peptidase YedK